MTDKHRDELPFVGLMYYRALCLCGWRGPRRWKREHTGADVQNHLDAARSEDAK